jgi:A/G-specific adenine glycosylase
MSEKIMEENYNSLPSEETLLNWYRENRRDLPWRRDKNPYHVWVSEIMLQQTRVEAVKDYYRRFMDALPTIAALAEADEDTYMKLWEGLGYYSRIRNMHKAAGVIVRDYGGAMPRTRAELLKLPGIGAYTASAIASIAFGERTPAIDGNLLRVFSRMTHYKEDIKKPAARKAAENWYLTVMTDRDPGSFNQALMDLGAGICIPKGDPACLSDPAACPWGRCCLSCQNADPQDYPKTAPKKSRRIEDRTVFLIQHGGQIALRKRPEAGLLAGLWEFPNTLGKLNRSQALQYAEFLGFSPLKIKKLPAAKHVFSHVEWRMTGWQILADEWRPLAGSENRSSKDQIMEGAPENEPYNFINSKSGEDFPKTTENGLADERSENDLKNKSVDGRTGNELTSDTSGNGSSVKKSENDRFEYTVYNNNAFQSPADASGIILADAEEVRDHYSIPSAFQAFKKRIL